ncbi:MAG: hypothetical protein WCG63_05380 [Opitutaceae bacterium]
MSKKALCVGLFAVGGLFAISFAQSATSAPQSNGGVNAAASSSQATAGTSTAVIPQVVTPALTASPATSVPTVTQAFTVGAAQPVVPAAPLPVPATINSGLTTKEILDANSQAVTHLATMFQTFGLLITAIVAVGGALATWLGLTMKKGFSEMMTDWTTKLGVIKSEMEAEKLRLQSEMEAAKIRLQGEMDAAKLRLQAAVEQADKSAADASRTAQSILDAQTVMSKTLQYNDEMRAKFASQMSNTTGPSAAAAPGSESSAVPPESPREQSAPVESVSEAETAEIKNMLKGKLGSPPGEGGSAI